MSCWTLTELEEMKDALKEAVKTGARRVKWNGKETEYQTLDEVREFLKYVCSEIDDINSGGGFTNKSGIPLDL